MNFTQTLVHGKLIKRYKRFLANVVLDNGNLVTAHCTNSGSMKSCLEEGAEVYMSISPNPNRKLPYTWEMIKINGNWVGINTSNPNRIAAEILTSNWLSDLPTFDIVKQEVKFEDSRFDLYAEAGERRFFFEVKNVTLKEGDFARFPDAITTRGRKHLQTLIKAKAEGFEVAMIYIIQRVDVSTFGPAWNIDPDYSNELTRAFAAGVRLYPVQVQVSPKGIEPLKLLPIELNGRLKN